MYRLYKDTVITHLIMFYLAFWLLSLVLMGCLCGRVHLSLQTDRWQQSAVSPHYL